MPTAPWRVEWFVVEPPVAHMTATGASSSATAAAWQATFDEVVARWDDLALSARRSERLVVRGWTDLLALMTEHQGELLETGLWTSGPSELMAVLGLHHDEVRNCRVVRWLLDPSAPHGLGTGFLSAFLARIVDDVTELPLGAAAVGVEEVRGSTRADIVIRVGELLVVVEAKTFAPEGDGQCDEIEQEWSDESPELVFLTRRRHPPRNGDPRWHLLAWADIADDLDAALAATTHSPAPGRPAAREYLRALRRYL